MNIRLIILTVLLGGMLAGCMSLEKMYITPETQAIVQEKVAGREFTVFYYTERRENEGGGFYCLDYERLFVQGDSLQVEIWRRTREEKEDYRIEDYQQTKTERGATDIAFSAVGQDKDGKEVRHSYRMRIYAVDKIDVYVDGIRYPARFEALPVM